MKHVQDIDPDDFRVKPGERLNLVHRPTDISPLYKSKKKYRKGLARGVQKLAELQHMLYAHDRYSVLVIFQAMDAAGKDGAIRHVLSGVNPQGCDVYSFKQPSAEELDHDFLWRTQNCLPPRGHIGVFNRSYYEEVLIARVRPEVLASQKLPDETRNTKDFWRRRYLSIADAEAHLQRNGTRIVKIFLHLSKEEQGRRFLARIDEPEKNWKFSEADLEQRACWDAYMQAYAKAMQATSTEDAPWYVVPADDKKNARLIVSQILGHTLESLDIAYPEVSHERRAELAEIRKRLADGVP